MIGIALAGVRARPARLLLTVLAVTLGVGFIAGTFVLTDTMRSGYAQEFSASADKVAVAVLPRAGNEPAANEDSDAAGKPSLSTALLPRLRALPGVTAAIGTVRGTAPLLDRDGRSHGDFPTLGMSLAADGPLSRHTIVRGRVPVAPDEAALDAGVADETGFKPGEQIKVLDSRGTVHAFRLVGVVKLGIDQEVGLRGAVAFTPRTAGRMTGERGYAEIDLAGTVTTGQVRAALDAASAGATADGTHSGTNNGTAAGYEVLTGERLAKRLAAAAGTDADAITTGLLLFGLVALLVAGLVIYNTFTILVAQRARELAMLRCLGATRRQVFAGVLTESAVVGLAGSLLGLALGAGLGMGGLALLNAFGAELPAGGGAGLTPRTIVIALTVGVLMTLVSALAPARRATKVSALEALRAEPEPGERAFRLGMARWAITVLFGGLGAAAAGAGVLVMDPGEAAMFTVAGGGTLVFIAVVAVMPLLVRPLGRLVGWAPASVSGLPGRLAVANVRRAPGRTAATTIALTVGVGLMSLFAVLGASVKATGAAQIEEQFPVDYRLHTGAAVDRTVPRTVADGLRARSDLFTAVTEVRSASARIGGDRTLVGAVTASSLGGVLRPEMTYGSPRDLRPGSVMISESYAKRHRLRGGSLVDLRAKRETTRLTVSAIYAGEATFFPDLVLAEPDFDRSFGARGDESVFLNVRDGAVPAQVRAAVDTAVRPYPLVKVSTATAMKSQLNQAIDMLLAVFAGLLGLTVLIALFGIANTLTLSVVERTRESALLRALGVTRRQLRGMLSVEAIIMSLIGALTGVALGVLFGWLATRSLMTGFVFRLPYGQVALFLALAGLAGLGAAVLPARRAAKASIVESLAAGDT